MKDADNVVRVDDVTRAKGAVDVGEVLENAPLSILPLLVLLVSFLVIMVDGFDLICLSFVATQLAKEFGIPVAQFGPIFTAGYVGILVGGLFIGPLADSFGRKSILIGSVLLFGVFSLLPLIDLSYERLILYRFVVGLGLGGAMPPALALTTEYAPIRLRGLFANLMFVGVPTGGVLGGFLASRLVPEYGWQVVFWMGGIAPLILIPAIIFLVSESLTFLAVNKMKPQYIARTLNRFVGKNVYSESDDFFVKESGKKGGNAPKKLFTEGRAMGTLLIWLVSFAGLLTYSVLSSWLPTFMTMSGFTTQQSIIGPVVLNLGGIIGATLLGIILTHCGLSPVISFAFLSTAAALVTLSSYIADSTYSFYAIFGAGFFLLGSISTTNTLMATFYPTKIRATGVGIALGSGRVGGALGPMGGGLLLASQFSVSQVCQAIAMTAIIGGVAAAAIALFYPSYRKPAASAT